MARNMVACGRRGQIELRVDNGTAGGCLVVVARDDGPPIPAADETIVIGLQAPVGLGWPSLQRLMDGVEVETSGEQCMVVTARKWTGSRCWRRQSMNRGALAAFSLRGRGEVARRPTAD